MPYRPFTRRFSPTQLNKCTTFLSPLHYRNEFPYTPFFFCILHLHNVYKYIFHARKIQSSVRCSTAQLNFMTGLLRPHIQYFNPNSRSYLNQAILFENTQRYYYHSSNSFDIKWYNTWRSETALDDPDILHGIRALIYCSPQASSKEQ